MNNGEDAFIVLMAIVFVVMVITLGVYYAQKNSQINDPQQCHKARELQRPRRIKRVFARPQTMRILIWMSRRCGLSLLSVRHTGRRHSLLCGALHTDSCDVKTQGRATQSQIFSLEGRIAGWINLSFHPVSICDI